VSGGLPLAQRCGCGGCTRKVRYIRGGCGCLKKKHSCSQFAICQLCQGSRSVRHRNGEVREALAGIDGGLFNRIVALAPMIQLQPFREKHLM
jgi:hypothetical protein